MEDINSLIREKMKAFRMINLILALGSVMYGLMMVYIYLYAPIPVAYKDVETMKQIEYALFAYALISIFIGKKVREMMLSSPNIFKESEASKRTQHPPFFANYISMLFVVWTVFETVSISGIVVFLLVGHIEFALVLVGIAVFAKLINGPRYEELTDLAARYEAKEIQG